MTIVTIARRSVLFLPLFLLVFANPSLGQNPQIGQAQYALGTLLVVRPDGIEDRLRGRGSLSLFEHDIIKTEAGSRAAIELADGARISLNENTQLQLLSRWEKNHGVTRVVRLKRGQLWVRVAAGTRPVEIETVSGTAIVSNAEVDFRIADDGQSALSVLQGAVQFATAYGWCTVTAATTSTGALGRGCSANTKSNPQQISAWSRDLLK